MCVAVKADHMKIPLYLNQMGLSQAMPTSWLSTSLACDLLVRHFKMKMMDVFSLLMLHVTLKQSGRISLVVTSLHGVTEDTVERRM